MDLVKLVPIADLDVSGHYRKHVGDLDDLADSIDRLGLLHPIVITPDKRLIAGLRRYQACKDVLGWTEILCRVLDLESMLAGQYAENEVRKDFTASERVAIAKAIEAEIGHRSGRPSTKQPSQGGNRKSNGSNDKKKVAEMPPFSGGQKTRDAAAEGAGFGSTGTYRQARTVVEEGEPEVVEAMDNEEISIAAAAEVAKLPPEEQKEEVKKRRGGGRKKKAESTEDEEVPPQAASGPTDGIGLPVPERVADVFASRKLFAEARALYKQLTTKLNELASHPVADQRLRKDMAYRESAGKGYYRHKGLEGVWTLLKFWRPWVAECPYCNWEHPGEYDPECKGCLGAGWATWEVWRRTSPEMQQAVKELLPAESQPVTDEDEE